MYRFLISKSFFEYWDNFFTYTMVNLGFVTSLMIPLAVPALAWDISPVLAWATLILGLLWLGWYSAGAARFLAGGGDDSGIGLGGLRGFLRCLISRWKSGLTLAVSWSIAVLLFQVAIPFYAGIAGLPGMAAIALIFWAFVIFAFAMLYFAGISSRDESGDAVIGVFKRSVLFFLDNIFLSIGVGLIFLIGGALSAVSVFILLGPAFLLRVSINAVRFLEYKYEYITEHPEHSKQIPWAELIHEDRVRMGRRSFKGMIFPWKD